MEGASSLTLTYGGLGNVGHTKLNGKTSWKKLHLTVFRKQERISTYGAGPGEKA